jgi:hypothetical protein
MPKFSTNFAKFVNYGAQDLKNKTPLFYKSTPPQRRDESEG